MEIEGEDGSRIRLKTGAKTVFGRGSGFNTKDRTVSRHHVLFRLETAVHKTNSQTQSTVAFEVVGKNPTWVKSGEGYGEIKVFRKSEKGELEAGDWFCISSQIPIWFKLKRTGVGEVRDVESETENESSGNLEYFDISQIDPVKEFGFIVIGHEFDGYPKKRIPDVKNWDWFLEEPEQEDDSEVDVSYESENKKKSNKTLGGIAGRVKRKKVGGNGDDEDWTGEKEEDKEVVVKARKGGRSKYVTRSKDQNKPCKDNKRKKHSTCERRKTIGGDNEQNEDKEEDDDTLGGFIVTDEEEEDEEQVGESDEEEEFIDDEEELDD